MKTVRLILPLLLAAACLPGFAQEPQDVPVQTAVYRNSIAQDDLRAQTDRVRQDLKALLEEFRQALPEGAEQAQIEQALAQLGVLSEKEMNGVVQMLRETSTMETASAMQGKLLTASQRQKAIQMLLKSFSDRLSIQQAEAAMNQRLRQLRLRQIANIHQTQDMIAPDGKKTVPDTSRGAMSASEQNAIKEETELCLNTLRRIAAGAPETKKKAAYATALQKAEEQQLTMSTARAALDTVAGRYPDALQSQQSVADTLQLMLRTITTEEAVLGRLQSMASQLRDLSEQQRQAADATQRSDPPSPKENRETQRSLSVQLAAIKDELRGLDAKAAAEVEKAQAAMRHAEEALRASAETPESSKTNRKKPSPSAPLNADPAEVAKTQNAAAEKLAEAEARLKAQLAELSKNPAANPPSATAALNSLQQLGQKINETLAQQKALANPPASNQAAPAAQQSQLAEKAADLQQKALPSNPAAARALGEAAHQMQQAADTPANKQEAAQKAMESLTEAGNQVQAQIQAITQTAVTEQTLQALSAQIQASKAQIQQGEPLLQKATDNDLTPAIKQMDAAAAPLQQATLAAFRAGDAASPTVRSALQDARKHLDQSKLQAAQMQQKNAIGSNQQAQKDCDRALEALRAAAEQLLDQALPQTAQMRQQQQAQKQQNAQQKNAQQQSPPPKGTQPQAAQQQSQQQMQNAPEAEMVHQHKDLGGSFIQDGAATGGTIHQGGALKPKEREAITLLEREKAPPEYSGMVQQYTKNLANGEAPSPTPQP